MSKVRVLADFPIRCFPSSNSRLTIKPPMKNRVKLTIEYAGPWNIFFRGGRPGNLWLNHQRFVKFRFKQQAGEGSGNLQERERMQMTQTEPLVNVATTWLRSCSGCHVKMFDLREGFFNLRGEDLKINFFTALDEKNISEVDIGIIEGAVANKENERILKRLREKSKILVAVGTCACFGALPGIRNMFQEECIAEISDDRLGDRLSRVECSRPQGKPLHQFVTVDYAVPGCPPLLKTLKETITNLLKGQKPKPKAKNNLCTECKRKKSAVSFNHDLPPDLDSFHRALQNYKLDPTICFLEQGVMCRGNTTAEGCGARCLKGNVPCWGCMGPVPDLYEGEMDNFKILTPPLLNPESLSTPKPGEPFPSPVAAESALSGKEGFFEH